MSTLRGDAPAPPAEAHPVGGPLASVLDLPPGKELLLYGHPGTGKTTAALLLLGEGAVVLTGEMRPTRVLSYCRRLGIKPREVWPLDVLELDPIDGAAPLVLPWDEPADLVVDSLTSTGQPLAALQQLQDYLGATGRRAIVTSQVTEKGEPRGPHTIPHECFAVARLELSAGVRRIVVHKNRGGSEAAVPWAIPGEAAKYDPTLYYIVEGRFPGFKLTPYMGQEKGADVYKEAGKGGELAEDFPPPPLAVSARKVPLYPSGWVEPPDAHLRREFCQREGVPYWSPLDERTDDGDKNRP